MHVALVENAEDDIHDKDRSNDKERQCPKKLLEDEPLALQVALDAGWQYFGGGFLNIVNRIAERDIGLGVETEGNTGELIEVIDRLQTDVLLRSRDRTNRDHRVAVVGFHVDFAKILRIGARLIVGLDDDLILVIRLFN